MRRSRLVWQVAVPFALLIAAGLLAVTWQAADLLRISHTRQIQEQLMGHSALLEEVLGGSLAAGTIAELDPVAKRLGQGAGIRVTLLGADGSVLGESDREVAGMDNHRTRPEVVAALADGVGSAVRHSDSVSTDMMYVARAVRQDGRLLGLVRVGLGLQSVEASGRELAARSAVAGVVVALLTISLGLVVARRIARPLEDLEGLAEEFARGEFRRESVPGGSVEVERVSDAMRRMAAEIHSRIEALVAERAEQEAVLSSMVEGVVAVAADGRIIAINSAAARLLAVDAREAIGRRTDDVVRDTGLAGFIEAALGSEAPLERDLVLGGADGRLLQVHGARVRDAAGAALGGAVVVLNDVTRLRRLETVRRDFVANVSHELKTPVTAIKGFLETLLSGGLRDPDNAKRFVEISARQADRLGAIIEDLLLLSRIDQDPEQASIEKMPTGLDVVIAGAMDVCRGAAEQKGIHLEVSCEPGLSARINGALVEQAVVNLVDNAVKYSGGGSRVTVQARREGGHAVIAVADQGAGIEAEHLPRLFERFYRVDKARSRAAGGTGLGLAIVKHIAQAQGGSVHVDSTPGRGSTFTLRFPIQ